MENKSHALLAGVFVLLLGLAAVAITLWLTSDDGKYDAYELSSANPVTGLQVQAPVRYKGVPVGKVTHIGFDPLIPGNVLVQIDVEQSTPLTPNTYASLNFQGVTGMSFVQLDDAEAPLPMLRVGGSDIPRLPLKESQLSAFMNKLPEVMSEVKGVAERAQLLLSNENLAHVSSSLKNLDTATAKASTSIESLQTSINTKLNPALDSFPALTQDMRSSFEKMSDSASTVKTTFTKMGKLTDTMQQQIEGEDGMVANIKQGVTSISQSAGDVTRSAQEVSASVNQRLLPKVEVLSDEIVNSLQDVTRATNTVSDNPQALLYGTGEVPAGPGEEGFQP